MRRRRSVIINGNIVALAGVKPDRRPIVGLAVAGPSSLGVVNTRACHLCRFKCPLVECQRLDPCGKDTCRHVCGKGCLLEGQFPSDI